MMSVATCMLIIRDIVGILQLHHWTMKLTYLESAQHTQEALCVCVAAGFHFLFVSGVGREQLGLPI